MVRTPLDERQRLAAKLAAMRAFAAEAEAHCGPGAAAPGVREGREAGPSSLVLARLAAAAGSSEEEEEEEEGEEGEEEKEKDEGDLTFIRRLRLRETRYRMTPIAVGPSK